MLRSTLPHAPSARARLALAALACAWALACGGDPRPAARDTAVGAAAPAADSGVRVVDDGGRDVRLPRPAARVVSLIPSATETIIALGAADRVVGRTNYDVAPEVASRPSVGGGIDPSVEAIVALRPELVVTWAHDKRQATRRKLDELGIPTFSLATEDTTDVYAAMTRLGRLLGRDSAATALVARVRRELAEVQRSVAGRGRPTVLYVLYNDPPMTAGPGTFVAQLIGVAGGRSLFDDVAQLWPTVAIEEIVRRQPEVVVLPVGEFRSHAVDRLRSASGWRDLRAVRGGRLVAVPSNLLSRPGPNLGQAARALRAAIHPDAAATATASPVATHADARRAVSAPVAAPGSAP